MLTSPSVSVEPSGNSVEVPDFDPVIYAIIREAAAKGWEIVRWAAVNGAILEVKVKVDQTLVTQVDEAWEKAITDILKAHSHGTVRGEEFWTTEGSDKSLVWYIDPVDGTWSFTRGQQYSTVGVGLYRNGTPYMSAIAHPYEKKMLIAQAGKWTWVYEVDDQMNPLASKMSTRVNVSSNTKNPVVYMDALFNTKTTPRKAAFIEAVGNSGEVLNLRMTGSNIDQQFQVAMWRGDLNISDAKWGDHDLVIGALAIQEAGWVFMDVLTWAPVTADTQVAVGGSPVTVEKYREILQKAYAGYTGFR